MDHNTKRKVMGIVVGIFILSFLAIAYLYFNNQAHVKFKEPIILEYGETVDLETFESKYILKDKSKYDQLESLKLSSDAVTKTKGSLIAKTKVRESILAFDYEVKDTQAPQFEGLKDIEINQGEALETSFVSAVDVVDGELDYEISNIDELDLNQPGEYTLTFVAEDKNGNKTEETVKLVVKKQEESTGSEPETSTTDNNQSHIVVIENPHSELVLVNRERKLSQNFIPNLKEMPADYAVDSGYRATPNTVDAFVKMVDALYAETGLWLLNTSSYRDYEFQERLYTNYKNQHGQKEADRMSAKPGHSEHQTGLVIDVVTPGGSMWTFAETPQSTWVNKNAHKFGFIVRYPEGKEHITHYMPEAWHLRYLGVEAATKVYESHLTFDEWVQ